MLKDYDAGMDEEDPGERDRQEGGLPVKPPTSKRGNLAHSHEDPWIELIEAAAFAVTVVKPQDQSEALRRALEAPYRRLEEKVEELKLQAANGGLVEAAFAAMHSADGYSVTPRLVAAHSRLGAALRRVRELEGPEDPA
jgi:hypothetical protein